ncbi:MAG: NUDIX domain-containing protein [Candidatus Moranbacteria bacterium]|nr:NUDIX domain-containing protein [Candidatus Moranbacteria bacterium]
MSKIIDKLAWIHIKNRKVLGARTKGKAAFYVPGGKRETGESDKQALIREVKEELQVDLIPDSIEYMQTFRAQAYNKPKGTEVQMKCFRADFKGKIKQDNEIAELNYLKHNYVYHKNCPAVDKIILNYLKGNDLID